jgi:hypothetical protein
MIWSTRLLSALLALALLPFLQLAVAQTETAATPPEFPPLEKITEGFEEVKTADGEKAFYNIWISKKDGQMLAELPKEVLVDMPAPEMHFIALTVSSGQIFSGLQAGDMYVYWRRYDNKMALIAKNTETTSKGDNESKSSVKRLFTDRVLLDVPILTIAPRGGPVIDMDAMLIGQADKFFRGEASVGKPYLAKIVQSNAFKDNVELAFEVPSASGDLTTLHYSFSRIPKVTGYKPRLADERVGYFTTSYTDLGIYDAEKTRVRYINRWHLEKRDPSLKMSPPKEPIIFYLEHTTPVRYRRWVEKGVKYWNKAFEQVGLVEAIQVNHQDAETGAYMNLEPEDVRYNFIRWLNNNVGTAIGPSRVHPETGQILDADIILTDGWIRAFEQQFDEIMPKVLMEGMNDETLVWLAKHPDWDPRVRLASPDKRDFVRNVIQHNAAVRMYKPANGEVNTVMMGDEKFDGIVGRTSQVNGYCLAAEGRSFDIASMRMFMAFNAALEDEAGAEEDADKDKDKEKEVEPMLDGMPESFIGPLLADLVAHEVGHTLGLRHNFKASSIYTIAEINSDEIKGKKPLAGSVMDYLPTNFNFKAGKVQGDYAMIDIGPYDLWAIDYGYTFNSDLKPILERVAEPELAYATDEDTGGPDPFARRYDFAKDPLDYGKSQTALAKFHRERIIEHFVKDGDSWSKARRGYELTLQLQTRATSMMANWLGGALINRDKKGDKNGRAPIEAVPAQQQRDALQFVMENTFRDDAYGLTPELLSRMTVDKWSDDSSSIRAEPTWPIHDRVMGIQASTLTSLMNPTVLRRVYDNEQLVAADQDALTLPELLDSIRDEIWSEISKAPGKKATDREPAISSLRRNLQREHVNRLIDLLMDDSNSAAARAISNLTMLQLRELGESIGKALVKGGVKYDRYTNAHLQESKLRIEKALDANATYNISGGNNGGILQFRIGDTSESLKAE